MINLVPLKALAGFNYVRVDQVIAVTASEATKCTIYLTGGVMVSCSEPAKDVLTRLAAAIGVEPPPLPATEETT
jgi:hypothetical protein